MMNSGLGTYSFKEMQEKLGAKESYMRKGSRYKNLNSDECINELQLIQQEYNSTEAQYVVDYAEKHKDSEFYKGLEWDNDKCGELYRRQQVHQIISDIIIVYDIKKDDKDLGQNSVVYEIQAYSHIDSCSGYRPTVELLSSESTRNELYDKALKELLYWESKWEYLVEFGDVCKEINKLKIK